MAEFFLAKSSATGDMRWFLYTRGASVPTPVLPDTTDLDVDLLRQALVDQASLIDALLSRVAVLEAKQTIPTQTPTPGHPGSAQGQESSAGKGKPGK